MSVHNTPTNSIVTRPPLQNYPLINNYHHHYAPTTNRPPYASSSSNSYKPHVYRPSTSLAGGSHNLWEQDNNHISPSVTNQLDNYFEVDQAEAGEPLPHPQAFAVGNVLDLNDGADEGDDYGYKDGSYRPVPGTTQKIYSSLNLLYYFSFLISHSICNILASLNTFSLLSHFLLMLVALFIFLHFSFGCSFF